MHGREISSDEPDACRSLLRNARKMRREHVPMSAVTLVSAQCSLSSSFFFFFFELKWVFFRACDGASVSVCHMHSRGIGRLIY